ncbi:MAG TPA: PQQ-binding-like beta-propeller repeat protein [Gemmataceae bacterium]|nr:PQQ-binding-like beta-propeller repeat protein [Gemmataceae bacterium]
MRCLIPLLILATPALADDWPQWLGPKRDGYWRETGILDKFPDGGPKVLWRKPCGMGYAGPAVANGRVFIADRALDPKSANPDNPFAKSNVGGTDRVLCLDEKTGDQRWKFEHPVEYRVSYAAGPRCTPTVDGDVLYWLDTMGDLFALDAKTGKRLWHKNFMNDFGAGLPVWGFSAHPLVDGNNLICLVGGDEGRGVMALDKKTGKEVWRALSIKGDPGYNSPTIFDVKGKRVLVIWHTHAVVGLDPATGKKLWEHPWEIASALTAVNARLVNDSLLFLSGFYNGSLLLDIGGTEPEVVWKSKSKGGQAAVMPNNTVDLHSIMTTPFIQGDTIYGVCSYGELRGLELMTGKRLWETHAATSGKSARWGHAFIIPHEDRVFLFNEQGELIIAKLSPTGYEEMSRAKLLEPTNKYAMGRTVVWSHPAFANKNVYVRNDKEIVAVSLKRD